MAGPSRAGTGGWPAARAVLIAVVLVLQLLDAIPLPELKKKHLAEPVAKAEIKRWTQLFNDLGAGVTEAEVTERALAVGGAMGRFRKTVLRPWAPFRHWTGTGQNWGLFAYPYPDAGRLVVDGLTPGKERVTLYQAPGDGEDWLVRRLEYRRVRGIYDDAGDRAKPRALYKALARAVSIEVFERHPELDAVEVRLDLVWAVVPGEGEEPAQKRRHVRKFYRDKVMP